MEYKLKKKNLNSAQVIHKIKELQTFSTEKTLACSCIINN